MTPRGSVQEPARTTVLLKSRNPQIDIKDVRMGVSSYISSGQECSPDWGQEHGLPDEGRQIRTTGVRKGMSCAGQSYTAAYGAAVPLSRTTVRASRLSLRNLTGFVSWSGAGHGGNHSRRHSTYFTRTRTGTAGTGQSAQPANPQIKEACGFDGFPC